MFCVLIRNNGRTVRGEAAIARLGIKALSLDSLEGHIVQVTSGKKGNITSSIRRDRDLFEKEYGLDVQGSRLKE